jgi:hypothetical protein
MGTVLGTVPIASLHSLVNSGLEPWRDVCPNVLEVEICAQKCARARWLTAPAAMKSSGEVGFNLSNQLFTEAASDFLADDPARANRGRPFRTSATEH